MINSDTIKKGSWLVFFSVVFLSALGPSNIEYYWWAYWFFCASFFVWTLYLVYWCESYVVYLTTVLTATVSIFAFLASGLVYLSASSFLGETTVLPIVVGVCPAILIFGVFSAIYFSKPSLFPFESVGNRITIRSGVQGQPKYNIGIVAGVTALTGGVFLSLVDALTTDVVAVSICTGCAIAILIQLRHTIRGLRTLHIQERSMDVPYTFMEIDEIREARSRWWLGRLLKWLTSLRSST